MSPLSLWRQWRHVYLHCLYRGNREMSPLSLWRQWSHVSTVSILYMETMETCLFCLYGEIGDMSPLPLWNQWRHISNVSIVLNLLVSIFSIIFIFQLCLHPLSLWRQWRHGSFVSIETMETYFHCLYRGNREMSPLSLWRQ